MKKLVTIFLLFIISIQCLPVKELGKQLFDSSIVEEDAAKKAIDKKDTADLGKEFFLTAIVAFHSSKTVNSYSLHIADIPSSPVTEIPVPPPNA